MKSRRSLIALLVLAVVLVGGLAAYINLSTPQGVAMPWNLTGMGGMNSSVGEHHPFDQAQAQTMTSLEVHVEQWPANEADANAWLSQTIDYGFNTVTITLRPRPPYVPKPGGGGLPILLGYDTGGWVTVALREPLRSRSLIDGATGKVIPYPRAP
jgi:uncharacterized membrane protein